MNKEEGNDIIECPICLIPISIMEGIDIIESDINIISKKILSFV